MISKRRLPQKADVYAYGVVASGTLHQIENPFPQADGYGEIIRSYSMAGGEAANSSIVLSRLGLRVVIDGCWIDRTPGAKAALDILKTSGVDTTHLKILRGGTGLWEIVISDGPSRTVFGNYGKRMKSRIWNRPSQAQMARSRIVCLDPALGPESIQAGRMARRLNIPYVTIDRPCHEELGRNAAALIVSNDFLKWKYPKISKASLFSKYRQDSRGIIIFTSGDGVILYGRNQGVTKFFRPPKTRPLDTTGAGDAFRAGVIFGLLQNWPDPRIIRYAAMLAARVCMTVPATVHSPRLPARYNETAMGRSAITR